MAGAARRKARVVRSRGGKGRRAETLDYRSIRRRCNGATAANEPVKRTTPRGPIGKGRAACFEPDLFLD